MKNGSQLKLVALSLLFSDVVGHKRGAIDRVSHTFAKSFSHALKQWSKKVGLVADKSLMSNNAASLASGTSDCDCNYSNYTYLTDDNINVALDDWFDDQESADEMYGEINCWDVSRVTDFDYLFSYYSDFSEDLNCWNTSNADSMKYTFAYAESFDGDISSWDVSGVTSMYSMFWHAETFNGDLTSWDTTSVTDMSWMFSYTYHFNQDLSSWNVDNVEWMSYMFNDASFFYQELCWDIADKTTISMFDGSGGCIQSDCCSECDSDLLCETSAMA